MSRAAIRYAKAVLSSASDKGAVEAVYHDMRAVVATLSSSKELRIALKSPVIKGDDKREALHQVFSGANEETLKIIDVLVANKRAYILDKVAESYIKMYNESQGMVVAQVTTAVELNKKLEDKVLAKVTEITKSKKAKLEHTIDPAILGGFILRIGDVQYDASIASQLYKVEQKLSKSV
ncbi:MAG: ATP synthase F1 subunit delta [Cytophagaceae bacterium]|nr:ATP synthase F1 subunit delta [Cytophagaceae bacterium]|tara:strand:- start:30613 stop:31149 length:537 start_codon:yes stop_codon:yes gene_type:complete